MKKLIIALLTIVLAACGSNEADQEYKDKLKESEENLRIAKEKNAQMKESLKDIEETSEDLEDLLEVVSGDSNTGESNNGDDYIETVINELVDLDLNDTDVLNINLIEDETKEEMYNVIVDLEWNVKNKPSTTKEMLDMYSDHLAASLYEVDDVSEVILFWTVPYHNEDESILKRAYEKKEEGMLMTDEMADVNIFN